MKSKEFEEGHSAHINGSRRTRNPYVALALAWDAGWRTRQIEQLPVGDKCRVSAPRRYIGEQLLWEHSQLGGLR